MALLATVVGGGSTLAATALFLSRYPRRPQLREGKYSVGACLARWDGCPACQIYYPTKKGACTSTGDSGSWFRRKLIDRVHNDYLKKMPIPSFLLRFLECRPPHTQNAPIEVCDGAFPVIIFSHGLMGSLDMYKTVCGGLAAGGYVVIAMEHEDGSALFAETEDGHVVARQPPPERMEYTRDNVSEFRAPFLRKRIDETSRTISALRRNITSKINGGLVDDILAQMDKSCLHCVGHSFGSTTCALALHELREANFKGCVLLDLWPLPLPRSVDEGLVACPVLFISSESFPKFKDFQITQRLAENTKNALGPFVISGAAHQSFSDTPCVLPRWLGSRIYLCGSEDVDKVYQTILDSTLCFLQHCSLHDLDTLQNVEASVLANPLISKL